MTNADFDERSQEPPALLPVDPSELYRNNRPRPGFWLALVWCIVFVLVLLICLVVGMTVDLGIQLSEQPDRQAFLDRIGDLGPNHDQLSPELAQSFRAGFLASEIGTVLFALIILRLKLGSDWRRKIALVLPSAEHAIIAILMIPAFVVVSGVVGHLFRLLLHPAGEAAEMDLGAMLGDILRPWPAWLSVLVIGVGPGIGEELWCRGFLGRGLVGRYGIISGVLATSFLFGMMHGPDPAYILTTTFMGACLHCLYLATRSLMLPMLVHFGNNSIATLLSLGHLDLKFLNADADLPPIGVVLAGIGLFVACAYAIYCGKVQLADSEEAGPIWRPVHPGVELPPDGSVTRVIHTSVMGLPMGFVILSFGLFALSCYLAN